MTNWQPEVARSFHEATKHAPGAVWRARPVSAGLIPRSYKLYADIPPLPLPSPQPSGAPAFDCLGTVRPPSDRALSAEVLAGVLHYSAGIVRRTRIRGREIEFRAASCTGALYHLELYVVCGAMAGLGAGVYHYGVHDRSLRRLRPGDYRPAVARALCLDDVSPGHEAFIVITSTFWRNAWRYEDRAYRHAFWDCGTVLVNLLAVAAGHQLRAKMHAGFLDADVNALLGVDAVKEAAVAVVGLGVREADYPASAAPVRIEHTTVPLSRAEIEYPLLDEMHAASCLRDCVELGRWRHARSRPLADDDPYAPPSWPERAEASADIETVIERRGSARRFRRQAMTLAQLNTLLAMALHPPAVEAGGPPTNLTRAFVIVNAVEGLLPGAYVLETTGLRLLREGDFRAEAAHLALDQGLAGDAATNIYFLADLDSILASLGNRGYRAAQLEGGLRGGRLYLAASALGLRATGLTFYDDEVIDFFGADARGLDAMFLVALGR